MAFCLQRSAARLLWRESRPSLLQQAVQRFRIAQLLTAGAFRQVGNDLAGGFHPDVGDQQLFFQLFKQIIVDLLTAEQADKSGTEILLRFQQATFEAGEETFFVGFSCS